MSGSPSMSGVAKRRNKTLKDMWRSMIYHSSLSHSLYRETLKTVAYILTLVFQKNLGAFKFYDPTKRTNFLDEKYSIPWGCWVWGEECVKKHYFWGGVCIDTNYCFWQWSGMNYYHWRRSILRTSRWYCCKHSISCGWYHLKSISTTSTLVNGTTNLMK